MFNIYADARPVIDDDQKDDPAEFAELAKLMETMRQIEIKEGHGTQDHPSQEDILSFYRGEAPSETVHQLRGSKRKPTRTQ
jgi:hypothetical protein